jgi:O-antigen/teichoic acid export membrane protein
MNLGLSVILICTVFGMDKVLGRIVGAAVPTIFFSLVFYIYFIYKGKKFWNIVYLKHYVYGIPLIPHHLSHFILGNADKIMIQNLISPAANGIYSLVYNIGYMVSVLIEALNNVWYPWMFRKLESGDTGDLRKMYTLYTFGFSAVAIAIAAVSPEVIKIIAPVTYWEGIEFVLWIVFSTYLIFIYQLYVYFEYYEMKTYLISIGTVIAAVINIVLNMLFLQEHGYGFAAVSTMISYLVLTIFHMIVCTFIIKRRIIHNGQIWLLVVITFGIICLLQLVLEWMFIRWFIAIVIMAGMAVVVYRDYKKDGVIKQFKQ